MKTPSILKDVSTEGIRSLTIKQINKELSERTPILYSTLRASAIATRSKRGEADLIPGIAVAASVLLKERCRRINGLQLMLTTIIKFSGFHVSAHLSIKSLLH